MCSRVWDSNSSYKGELSIGESRQNVPQAARPDDISVPHYGAMVQALAIDPKSRYIASFFIC